MTAQNTLSWESEEFFEWLEQTDKDYHYSLRRKASDKRRGITSYGRDVSELRQQCKKYS